MSCMSLTGTSIPEGSRTYIYAVWLRPSQHFSRTLNTTGGARNATARAILPSGEISTRTFGSFTATVRSLKKCSSNRSLTVLLSLYLHRGVYV